MLYFDYTMKNVTPQFKDLLKKFIDEKHDRQLIIIFSLLVFVFALLILLLGDMPIIAMNGNFLLRPNI